MRLLIIAGLSGCIASAGWAQNFSSVHQMGEGHSQITMQSGKNIAVTTQNGSDNHSGTFQDGFDNLAVTHQSGEGLEAETVQNGNANVTSTVQVTSQSPSAPTQFGSAQYQGSFLSIGSTIEIGPSGASRTAAPEGSE